MLEVRGGFAPEVVDIVGEMLAKLDAEAAMDLRSGNRILEVIGIAVPLAAKVKPCLGVLMDEERRVRTDITKPVIFERGSLPGIPGLYRQGVRRRSQAEKVHHHALAVKVPSITQETDLRPP